MMLSRQLVKVELSVLVSMILVAIMVGIYLVVDAAIQPNNLLFPPTLGTIAVGILATFVFGSIPAFFFGAPLYLMLFQYGRASWLASIALGAALSSPLFFMSRQVGVLAIVCGSVAASFTHAISRQSLSPNNSFKPKPLRGSA